MSLQKVWLGWPQLFKGIHLYWLFVIISPNNPLKSLTLVAKPCICTDLFHFPFISILQFPPNTSLSLERWHNSQGGTWKGRLFVQMSFSKLYFQSLVMLVLLFYQICDIFTKPTDAVHFMVDIFPTHPAAWKTSLFIRWTAFATLLSFADHHLWMIMWF